MLLIAACLHGWFSFNEHCYRAYHNGFSWSDARHNCHSKNSELVVITSSAENEFAGSLVHPNSTCTWIGLEVFNRELHWISSFHGNFTRWHNEESKTTKHRRTCVNFHHQSRMWVNSSCSSKCHYICKRKGGSKKPMRLCNCPLAGFVRSTVMIFWEIDERGLRKLGWWKWLWDCAAHYFAISITTITITISVVAIVNISIPFSFCS